MPSSRSKNSCKHHNDDHLHHHVHDHGHHDEHDDEHEREHDDERDDDNINVNIVVNTTGTTSMSSATTIISGTAGGGGDGGMPIQQPSLPPGIKKVVIFDTNAYRTLGRRKVQSLRQRELECGVLALAHPVVMLELSAHLADKNVSRLQALHVRLGGSGRTYEKAGRKWLMLLPGTTLGNVSPTFQNNPSRQ